MPVAVDDVTHQKPFEIISVNVVATRTHKIPMEPIFKWLWRKTKIFNLQMNGEYLSDFPKRKRRIYFNTFISVCSIVSHLIVSRLSWASTTVNYLYSSYRHYVWLACVFALAPHWIGFSSQIDTKLFFAFAGQRANSQLLVSRSKFFAANRHSQHFAIFINGMNDTWKRPINRLQTFNKTNPTKLIANK